MFAAIFNLPAAGLLQIGQILGFKSKL